MNVSTQPGADSNSTIHFIAMDYSDIDSESKMGGCCARFMSCLKHSPCASLVALLCCLIGTGLFTSGIYFAMDYTQSDELVGKFIPSYAQYILYGWMGATILFYIYIYICNSLSSSENRRSMFTSTGDFRCGSCINVMNVVLLNIAFLIWLVVACALSFPLFGEGALLYKDKGSVTQHDLSYYYLNNRTISTKAFEEKWKDSFIPIAAAETGAFLILLGTMNFAISVGINYARFEAMEVDDDKTQYVNDTRF